MVNSIDEFKLRQETQKAMESGRYMILITRIDDEDKEKPFKHFRMTSNFPREEIMSSIMMHVRELGEEAGLEEPAPIKEG